MSSFQIDEPNENVEEQIVWLRNPLKFTYLRESTYWTTRPRGNIAPKLSEMAFLVGYTQYRPAGYRTVYLRRFWWLKHHDRDLDNKGVYRCGFGPCEAVDPASIKINQKSKSWVPPANEIRHEARGGRGWLKMLVPFGKYKGRPMSEVPTDYLHWNVEAQQQQLKSFLDEIEHRESLEVTKISWAEQIIQSGYRTLTLKHHPDRRGNNGDMRELNGSHEALLKLLKWSGLS
jgi:Family of unknown function (DUF6009)/Putative quorum-sensing-regulated virulence factor